MPDPITPPVADPITPPAPVADPPPSPPSGSVLDKAKDPAPVADPLTPPAPVADPIAPTGFKITDGKIGDLAVPPKFLDKDGSVNVANLLKSNIELEKRMSTGVGKPPAKAEDYGTAFKPSEALKGKVDTLDAKDPVTQGFFKKAHELGLTAEQFNGMANVAYEMATQNGAVPLDPKAIADAEFAKLGPNAQGIVDGLNGWLGGLKTQGILSDAEVAEAKIMGGTKEGALVMLKLRELTGEQSIDLKGAHVEGDLSESEWRAGMAEMDPKNPSQLRYVTDQAFAKKMDGMAERIFGTGQVGTSRSGLVGVNVNAGIEKRTAMSRK